MFYLGAVDRYRLKRWQISHARGQFGLAVFTWAGKQKNKWFGPSKKDVAGDRLDNISGRWMLTNDVEGNAKERCSICSLSELPLSRWRAGKLCGLKMNTFALGLGFCKARPEHLACTG